MSKLNTIFETLQNKIDAGEITFETANIVLEKAKAKYTDEEVGELTEAAPLTLNDAILGINQLLNEAEELHNEKGTARTSSDGPNLPEKTTTGEGVTAGIKSNDNASKSKMATLAKNNEANAKADAQGEEDKDTTINADDVTESVNNMRLRVYEAADKGVITEEEKDLFLDYLNLDNYTEKEDDEDIAADIDCVTESVNNMRLRVYEAADKGVITEEEKDLFLDYLNLDNYTEKEDDEEDEEKEDDEDEEEEDDDKKKKKHKKNKDDDDDEECDHEDKDGDGECDKCGADMDDVEESYVGRILDAYTTGTITENQAIELITK